MAIIAFPCAKGNVEIKTYITIRRRLDLEFPLFAIDYDR